MKNLMKENVSNVNVGNALLCMPQKDSWNSFSKPVREIDKYPRSKKMIGQLNPTVQEMKL